MDVYIPKIHWFIIMFPIYTVWWFGTWLFWLSIQVGIIPTDELIFFRGVGIPPTSIYENIILYVRIYIYIYYIVWHVYRCPHFETQPYLHCCWWSTVILFPQSPQCDLQLVQARLVNGGITTWHKPYLIGGLESWNFIFHFIYGMSSQPHWRTPSCFKMVF